VEQFENQEHDCILDQIESVDVGGGVEEVDLSRI
jgi:hypothetical protein